MTTGESKTGRGYTQGSDSYRADDVDQIQREFERAEAMKRASEASAKLKERLPDGSFPSVSINEPLPMEPWR